MLNATYLAVPALVICMLIGCSGGNGSDQDGATSDGAAATGDSNTVGDGPGPGPGGDTSVPVNDTGQVDQGDLPCDPPCSSKQICDNGQCMDLPDQCPCPSESYCDLSTNTCVPGCVEDTDCKTGRYCDDQRQCQNGCREGECGLNEVCDLNSRTCQCLAGYHRCSGFCVAEGLNSCGPSCEICPTDLNGDASCTPSGCQLDCYEGYKYCGGSCAACPTDHATSFSCAGSACEATACNAGYHVCAGYCVVEDAQSCGPSCNACQDSIEGACEAGACYEVVDIGYFPSITSCADRCAAMGKSCGESCDIHYTRPGGTQYNQIAAGHYTQQAAFEPYGWLGCGDSTPGGAPTSIRCCCTEELTGTPQPGCTTHADCGSYEFCWADKQECYPTTDSSCPPGYTYKGQCSDGTNFCAHSGLPTGTTFPFEQPCPTGTTQRGGFYCSGETRVCVPD